MNKTKVIISVLIVLIVAGAAAGFVVGMKYQQTKQFGNSQANRGGRLESNNRQGQQAQGKNTGQQRLGMQGYRPLVGQILSQDDKSITVKLNDGSSKIVLFSQTTTVSKASQGAVADLKVGDTIRVFGSTSPDGSVIAQDIQQNPLNPMGNSGVGGTQPAPAKTN